MEENKILNEDRMVTLSDGIFAIALTLLVLNISLPTNLSVSELHKQLQEVLLSKVIYYIITFATIARYWLSHRRTISVLIRLDTRFLLLNLLFLAFIAFFPVAINLLGNYGHDPIVVIIYVLVLAGCGFSSFFLWLYATGKHRLVRSDMDQQDINFTTLYILSAPLFFLASLSLLYFLWENPSLIFYSWILLFFISFVSRGIQQRRRAKRHAQQATSTSQIIQQKSSV